MSNWHKTNQHTIKYLEGTEKHSDNDEYPNLAAARDAQHQYWSVLYSSCVFRTRTSIGTRMDVILQVQLYSLFSRHGGNIPIAPLFRKQEAAV